MRGGALLPQFSMVYGVVWLADLQCTLHILLAGEVWSNIAIFRKILNIIHFITKTKND